MIHFVILDNGGRSEWIGDNFCDDINNNKKCLYDDGDCCGLSAQKNFCFKCICKGKLDQKYNKVLIQSYILLICLPPLQFLHARWTLIVMAMVIVKTNLTDHWGELLANACA